MHEVAIRAKGKWREILPKFGFTEEQLRDAHGPCPICGGKDRYRFDDRTGSGDYYCNGCGAGDGIKLLQEARGWTFNETLRQVSELVGGNVLEFDDSVIAFERKRSALRLLWGEGVERDERLVTYLRGRGLKSMPKTLRYHPALAYQHDTRFYGEFPAMLAQIHGPDGSLQSIHRTFLGGVPGPRKKVMPPVRSIKGGAIRLYPARGNKLAITEGIETAIAVREALPRTWAVWSAVSTSGMQSFELPNGVEHLLICGDNDANYAGQSAAWSLAHRISTRNTGVDVDVRIPPTKNTDFLDWLRAKNGAA